VAEESSDSGEATTASPPGSVRIPFIIMAVLIAAFAAVGIASHKSKPKPFKTEGSRAVVLPAGDHARTVVVTPCSPPTVVNAANAAEQISVPGSVAVTVPEGAPTRTVVIPQCPVVSAPKPGALNVPSAAFVLGPGKQAFDTDKVPKGGDPLAYHVKSQVTLPPDSPATTVVARPCLKKVKAERTTILKPAGGSGGVAIAPDC
jgi:hypothetical protein